jgi:hypothetical protein
MDMTFGMWNVGSLYRASSLVKISGELSKHKLHFVGVQEVRCEGGGTEPAGEYTLFFRGMGIISIVLRSQLGLQLWWMGGN